MSLIDITVDADILDDLKGYAEAIGITEDEFAAASKKAVTVTTRTLHRTGLSRFAKASGAKAASLRGHQRVSMPGKGERGVVWFGLDPLSLSAFPDAAIRQVPKGFRIKKLGSMVWQRPPKRGDITSNIPSGHTGRLSKFTRKSGKHDALAKIYRRIFDGGFNVADQLGDEADALLEKNFRRELDQVIRRKKFAKK